MLQVNNHDFEDLPRNVDIAEDPQDKRVDDAQFARNDSGLIKLILHSLIAFD